MYPLYIHSCIYAIVYPYICPSIYFHRQRFRVRHPADSALDASFMYGVATLSRIDKIVGLFAKETYKRDDILQKRPIILSILLTVATPYSFLYSCIYAIVYPYVYLSIYFYTRRFRVRHPADSAVDESFMYLLMYSYVYPFIYSYIYLLICYNRRRFRVRHPADSAADESFMYLLMYSYSYIHISIYLFVIIDGVFECGIRQIRQRMSHWCIHSCFHIFIHLYVHIPIYLFVIIDGVFECGIQQIRQWMGVALLRRARQTEDHYNPKSGNALLHTATHCNTLQHTKSLILVRDGCGTYVIHKANWKWLQLPSGNVLLHTATHCNTLQHTKYLTLKRDGCGAYAMREANWKWPTPQIRCVCALASCVAVCCSVLQCVAVCCCML